MSVFKDSLVDFSHGNNLGRFWRLYFKRNRTKNALRRSILTYFMCRSASRHGGYVGPGAIIKEIPVLPHGLHGVYISRFAELGAGTVIYQNVTIGEVNHCAPSFGSNCLIGAGAVIVGNIHIGNNVRIGAGTVISRDIPDNCTVVSEPPRIIERKAEI